MSGWGCGGDDAEDDRCQGTSPTLHHPVVPIRCPKKCRASHAENAALPATELNRGAGASQLMPSDGIYLPQRSVCELPVRSVAAPGTRQRPTCVERQQQSFANSTRGQKRFLPTAAEHRADPRPANPSMRVRELRQRIPGGRAQGPAQRTSATSSAADARSSEPSGAGGCICLLVFNGPQSIFLPQICLMAFKILFCFGRCKHPTAMNSTMCHPWTF